jgi:hypothetical protein
MGHVGMHERLKLLGGRLSIRSMPGAGTTIVACVPLPMLRINLPRNEGLKRARSVQTLAAGGELDDAYRLTARSLLRDRAPGVP